MRKIRYLMTVVGVISIIFGGMAPLISHADEATQPTLVLSSNNNTVNVDATQTVTLQTHNLPTTSVVTIEIPTGIKIDQTKLNINLSSDEVTAVVSVNQVELKLTAATDQTINLPVTIAAEGNYQLQAKLAVTDVASNVLAINGQADKTTAATAAASTKTESDTTKAPLMRSAVAPTTRSKFSVTSDQTGAGGGLTYVYFYNNNVGLTLTGNLTSTASQTIYVGYSLVEAGQPASEKALTTIKTTGGTQSQKYSVTIPTSAFPAFTDANYGKVYSFRLVFRDTPFGTSTATSNNVNLRLVYAKGTLALTAPSEVNFGSDLAADFTVKPIIMGTVAGGSALSVVDTREFGTALPYKNGWSVTATLGSQMTGLTNKQTLTDSLHYINNGTDYTLGSAAVPIYSLKSSVKGTTNISKTWNKTTGLAFEPQVGQPQAGEKYQGVVQWNLQETPTNS